MAATVLDELLELHHPEDEPLWPGGQPGTYTSTGMTRSIPSTVE
jgi:hypothetical protein